MNEKEVLIEVKDLRKYFQVGRHQVLKAVTGSASRFTKARRWDLSGSPVVGRRHAAKP